MTGANLAVSNSSHRTAVEKLRLQSIRLIGGDDSPEHYPRHLANGGAVPVLILEIISRMNHKRVNSLHCQCELEEKYGSLFNRFAFARAWGYVQSCLQYANQKPTLETSTPHPLAWLFREQ